MHYLRPKRDISQVKQYVLNFDKNIIISSFLKKKCLNCFDNKKITTNYYT